jgi:hypothetical protein
LYLFFSTINCIAYLIQFPNDTPNELEDIYVNDTYPICQEAYKIKTGGYEVGLINLCKSLEAGEVENTNPKYKTWFDWVESDLCDFYNLIEEGDGIASDAEVSKY